MSLCNLCKSSTAGSPFLPASAPRLPATDFDFGTLVADALFDFKFADTFG